jgi:hypothetical protein
VRLYTCLNAQSKSRPEQPLQRTPAASGALGLSGSPLLSVAFLVKVLNNTAAASTREE